MRNFKIKPERSEADSLKRTKLVVFENSVNTVQFIQYVLNLTVENQLLLLLNGKNTGINIETPILILKRKCHKL